MLFGFDFIQLLIIFVIILVIGAMLVRKFAAPREAQGERESAEGGLGEGRFEGAGECHGSEDIVDM